jgi:hypothetical protein
LALKHPSNIRGRRCVLINPGEGVVPDIWEDAMAAATKRSSLCGAILAVAAAAWLLGPAPAAAQTVTPIFGFDGPEDLEWLSAGQSILVADFYHDIKRPGGLVVLDLAAGKPMPLPMTTAKQAGWGDPSCAAPPSVIGPHGIHLSKRADGKWQLLVVNHAERESIEFIEVVRGGDVPRGVWRGCVASPTGDAFNDVAATPEGGFIATVPISKAVREANGGKLPPLGEVSGYNVEWSPGHAAMRMAGTDAPFNNGVQVSPDGKTYYYNAWTAHEVRRVDRATGRQTGAVKLDFRPDNITWRADGQLVAAGITEGPEGPCPQVDGTCARGYGVAAIDPATMTATPLYHAEPGQMAGVSVALQTGDTLYVGGFTGARITRIALGR